MLSLVVFLTILPSLLLLLVSCASNRNDRKLSDETSSKTSLTGTVPSDVGVTKILPPKRTITPVQQPEPVPTTEPKTEEPPTAVERSMRVEHTQPVSSRLSTESLKPMEINHNDETKDDTESLKPYKLDVPSEVFMREGQLAIAMRDKVYLARKASENRLKEDVTVQSENTAKEIRKVSKLTKASKVKEQPRKIMNNDGMKTAKEKAKSARKNESKIKGKKQKDVSKKEREEIKTARRIIH